MTDPKRCVLLFSGGTDSLCSAALLTEKYNEIHLLTFYEKSTENSPQPRSHLQKLREHFPQVRFYYSFYSTDQIVKKLSYQAYWRNLLRFGLYNLVSPGLSSLSWHIRTIAYARRQGINHVHDGMTKELVHLPGHDPKVRELFQKMYEKFGMSFSSPVIEWDVPEDQRFVEKLIVDRHGFTLQKRDKNEKSEKKTTGLWLYKHGLLPHPNIKGSSYDRLSQHDCYPFVLYNIIVFWIFEPLIGYEAFRQGLVRFMKEKIELAEAWLQSASVGDFIENKADKSICPTEHALADGEIN